MVAKKNRFLHFVTGLSLDQHDNVIVTPRVIKLTEDLYDNRNNLACYMINFRTEKTKVS